MNISNINFILLFVLTCFNTFMLVAIVAKLGVMHSELYDKINKREKKK